MKRCAFLMMQPLIKGTFWQCKFAVLNHFRQAREFLKLDVTKDKVHS